ncbi:MAG: bifunctional phosphoribosyl-AMP cyclohydrolase/phosphoribosyl-ATP diphosphatase HisIE [Clostridia bacterium]|nr:bifunctional phosphoribosyl-AMP cyclohydrolase/phosphoribosyl-ATP diphosphatase HisIE [Clostridia bacterium]
MYNTEEISQDRLRFSEDGLIPAVVQDASTEAVLMLAYMNREALRLTCETGRAWFWSRSRNCLWEKGATSGNTQQVAGILVDCDYDTILLRVCPAGPACHEGTYTCFHRTLPAATVSEEPASGSGDVFDELYAVILDRKANPSDASYTSRLLQAGIDRVLRKVGEESGEFMIASKNSDPIEVVSELADLVYHSLVALAALGIPLASLRAELGRRRGPA